ncbi:glycoside hydrolase superfamily [Bisporella sp. PMI_857]|nr:glycoside hydrolase superfamily [Bisporella sp. PMI_857]
MHYISFLLSLLACSSIALSKPLLHSPASYTGNIKAKTTYGGGGKRTVGYYGNWDIYARSFFVTDIPASQLTHIVYSFMNVNSSTGEVFLSDEWADLQYAYPGDDTSASGTNLYGSLKQLYLLKKKNRTLKTLFSVGGWTYSPNFVAPLASPTLRSNLAKSAVKLMYNLGFDGINIDYEYVTDSTQAAQVVSLLKLLRQEMDAYAKNTSSSPFLLSFASPAGPLKYTLLDFKGMDQYLDFWDFMGFDYAGSWDTIAGHQANLFGATANQLGVNTTSGIEYYATKGCISPSKINLGSPLYGRSFNNTKGPGTNFSGIGTEGSFGEAGVWDYKALPVPGYNAKVVELPEIGASYSFDKAKGYMISYDTPKIATQKAGWVKAVGLGGSMWWEISMDKSGSDSLVDATVAAYGGTAGLDKSENHLTYPLSGYQNLKNGFPGE